MTQQASKLPDKVASCAHHWLIEGSAGHESRGQCKLCHEVRYFLNSEGVKLKWGAMRSMVLKEKVDG